MENLARKAKQADEMFTMLVRYMNDAASLSRKSYYTKEEVMPAWL
jgi:hypothetical protein